MPPVFYKYLRNIFSIWSLKYGDVKYLAIYLIKANISEVKTFKNALSYSNSNVYQLVTLKRGNNFKIHVVNLSKPIKILRGNMMSQNYIQRLLMLKHPNLIQ